APVRAAAAAPLAPDRPPSKDEIAELDRVGATYRRNPQLVLDEKRITDAAAVVKKLSPAGIKLAIGDLLDAAAKDAQKKLAPHPHFPNQHYAKSKAVVEQEIDKAVLKQHCPGVGAWREFLKLRPVRRFGPDGKTELPVTLYLRESLLMPKIDGYEVHVSL